ncbi:MAG: hypothetical protein ACJAYU_000139 [Bradymonadia bacterium]|jgi:hypothetical protein
MTKANRKLETAILLVTCFTLGWASSAAAQNATLPEAFIGTFMPHGLDGRDYVDEQIATLRDAMQFCYEEHLEETADTSGLMLMRVFVASDGEVLDVEMMQNRTGSGELANCVEFSLEEVSLDPSNRDNVSITLPVTFRMRDVGPEFADARSSRR